MHKKIAPLWKFKTVKCTAAKDITTLRKNHAEIRTNIGKPYINNRVSIFTCISLVHVQPRRHQ